VLLLIEGTDVVFAVDSVPAVLAVSHEQFIVFSSNAFAILGLRALYFLLADMHSRFTYLQEGLAIILAFVGVKMIVAEWYHIPTWLSLTVIAIVLTASIGFSLKADRAEEAARLAHEAFEDHPAPD
jgi:tellurite resistance protein TerC